MKVKNENISTQSVMQTYMLERMLERISISKYKDNFIPKLHNFLYHTNTELLKFLLDL